MTGYQHAPLPIPGDWQGQERQFALRLCGLLDEVYGLLGGLRKREHPVGSTVRLKPGEDPHKLFGGTWQAAGSVVEWEKVKDC